MQESLVLSPLPDIGRRERVLRAALVEAGRLAVERYRGFREVGVRFKGPQDYLSEVDGEVERLLASHLLGEFPDDAFLGEEGGGEGSDRIWVVDPIDGTANFLRGIAHWCISVAYLADGEVRLGAILNPVAGELFLATAGGGATLNGRPMRAAATSRLDQASIEAGWSTRVPNADYLAVFGRLLEAGATVRRAGSGALGLAYVAEGRQDAYLELHINSWDCLAGILLVTEAGGLANPFLRGDGLRSGNPILVAAPGVADEVSRLSGIPLD